MTHFQVVFLSAFCLYCCRLFHVSRYCYTNINIHKYMYIFIYIVYIYVYIYRTHCVEFLSAQQVFRQISSQQLQELSTSLIESWLTTCQLLEARTWPIRTTTICSSCWPLTMGKPAKRSWPNVCKQANSTRKSPSIKCYLSVRPPLCPFSGIFTWGCRQELLI